MLEHVPLIGLAVLITSHFVLWAFKSGKAESKLDAFQKSLDRLERMHEAMLEQYVSMDTFNSLRTQFTELMDRHEREVFNRFDRISDRMTRYEEGAKG